MLHTLGTRRQETELVIPSDDSGSLRGKEQYCLVMKRDARVDLEYIKSVMATKEDGTREEMPQAPSSRSETTNRQTRSNLNPFLHRKFDGGRGATGLFGRLLTRRRPRSRSVPVQGVIGH